MNFDIHLRFQPSASFLGILADLNEHFPDWTDGSYDWADQTNDFLHNPDPLPEIDQSLLRTPLSQRAINDVLNVAIALLSGNFPLVRDYLRDLHFAFVIGYPRSGGSYLTKELLRSLDLKHTQVSEALAHDGFPNLQSTWYDWNVDRPNYHLQESIFQTAEFLVIANLYYRRHTRQLDDGTWMAPKKMHKMVAWASSFKMLLGQGRADYMVTIRHPITTAISIFEKSGGLPNDGRFPANQPRSAIEHWVRDDLMHMGCSQSDIANMTYFDAVRVSWSRFYTMMATSGLFLGDREEVELLPYGQRALEGVSRRYREHNRACETTPEPFYVDKARDLPERVLQRSQETVNAVTNVWQSLGLTFPQLEIQ